MIKTRITSEVLGLRYLLLSVMLLVAASLLAGCQSFSSQETLRADITYASEDMRFPEDAWPENLKTLFSRYWAVRYAGDPERLYEMEAPYIHEMIGKETYTAYIRRGQKNRLEHVEVHGFQWETPHLFTVKVEIYFTNPAGEAKTVYYDDVWVLAGGKWYHNFRDEFLFPHTL